MSPCDHYLHLQHRKWQRWRQLHARGLPITDEEDPGLQALYDTQDRLWPQMTTEDIDRVRAWQEEQAGLFPDGWPA